MGYLVIKKNEVKPFAATWMDPEIITLSKASQKEKKYHMILLICGILNTTQMNSSMDRNRLTDIEKRLEVAKGVGQRRTESLRLVDANYYI